MSIDQEALKSLIEASKVDPPFSLFRWVADGGEARMLSFPSFTARPSTDSDDEIIMDGKMIAFKGTVNPE